MELVPLIFRLHFDSSVLFDKEPKKSPFLHKICDKIKVIKKIGCDMTWNKKHLCIRLM